MYSIDFSVDRHENPSEPELDVITCTSAFVMDGTNYPSSEEIADCIIETSMYAEKIVPAFKQYPVLVEFEQHYVWVRASVPVLKSVEFNLDVEGFDTVLHNERLASFKKLVRKHIDQIMYVDKHIQDTYAAACSYAAVAEGYTNVSEPDLLGLRLSMLKSILRKEEHHFLTSENSNIYRAAFMLAHHYKSIGLF